MQNYVCSLCCLLSSMIVSMIEQIGLRLVIICMLNVFRWCSVISVSVKGSSVQLKFSVSSNSVLCSFGIVKVLLVCGSSGLSRVRNSVLVFSFRQVMVSGLLWFISCLLNVLNSVMKSVDSVFIVMFMCMLCGILFIIIVMFGIIVVVMISLCGLNCCCVIYGLMKDRNIGFSVMQVVFIEVLDSLIVLQKVSQCSDISMLIFVYVQCNCVGIVCSLCYILGISSNDLVISNMCYYIKGSVGSEISLLRMVVKFYSRIQKWICRWVLLMGCMGYEGVGKGVLFQWLSWGLFCVLFGWFVYF